MGSVVSGDGAPRGVLPVAGARAARAGAGGGRRRRRCAGCRWSARTCWPPATTRSRRARRPRSRCRGRWRLLVALEPDVARARAGGDDADAAGAGAGARPRACRWTRCCGPRRSRCEAACCWRRASPPRRARIWSGRAPSSPPRGRWRGRSARWWTCRSSPATRGTRRRRGASCGRRRSCHRAATGGWRPTRLGNLGIVEQVRSGPAAAVPHLRAALRLFREVGDVRYEERLPQQLRLRHRRGGRHGRGRGDAGGGAWPRPPARTTGWATRARG